MNTKQRVSAQRGGHLAVLAFNESAAIEFRCRGTPRDGRSRPTTLRYPGNVGSIGQELHLLHQRFSYCNLRCPSCLVGAPYGALSDWPRGLMSPELLGQIVDKALRECRISAVGLYNWTEPLLHPRIAELVRAVK